MHVSYSPFFQKVSEKELKINTNISEIRRKNLEEKIKKVIEDSYKRADASIYVGYAAAELNATTSGQVSDIYTIPTGQQKQSYTLFSSLEEKPCPLTPDEEEIYASWIGGALGIGVGASISWLVDREDILWVLYEGWRIYRKYLNQIPGQIKGRQIETWNGNWLKHHLDGGDDKSIKIEPEARKNKDEETLSLPTVRWSNLLLTLCRKYPREIFTIYAYSLGQTNTTLGFFNLYLPEVHRMYELRRKIFLDIDQEILTDSEIEKMETHYYSFKYACKLGSIGLRAIEPKKLREYLSKKETKYDIKKEKIEDYKKFLIFKLWICAMINKKELLDLATELAEILIEFEKSGGSRGVTKDDRLSEEVRTAPNVRIFTDKWSEVLSRSPKVFSSEDRLRTIREAVHQIIKMPSDQFPLFVALLRFEYSYIKNASNEKNNH